MIDKELEEKAQHYADCVEKEYNIPERIKRLIKSAYIVGANERLSNVWHPASEEPDNLTQIVCVCNMFGSKQVCSFRVDKGNPIEWRHIVKFRHLEKWAYFNELIEY